MRDVYSNSNKHTHAHAHAYIQTDRTRTNERADATKERIPTSHICVHFKITHTLFGWL